jgi:hypothetical protein
MQYIMSISVLVFAIALVAWLVSALAGVVWSLAVIAVGGLAVWRVVKYAMEQKGNDNGL